MRRAGFHVAPAGAANSGKSLKSWRVSLAGALVAGLAGLTGFAGPGHAQTTVAGVTPGALAVDAMGQAGYSIPIDLPPGIAGMAPSLALNYSSGGGNGIAGMGWSISGLSAITRCGKTPAQDGAWGGINYDAEDRFCLDGKRLVAVSGVYGADGTEYRTEIDGFFRVVSYGKVLGSAGLQGTSPLWFRVWAKSGQIMDYGATGDARIEAVRADMTIPEVRAWGVDRIADSAGNYLTFSYFKDSATGAHRIDRIDYTYNDAAAVTARSSVQFVYEARPDVSNGYTGGALITRDVRLAAIRTWTDSALVRDYRLAYETGAATGRSRLLSVTECDGVGGTENCLAPTTFAWKLEDAGFTGDAGYVLPAEVGSLGLTAGVGGLREGAFVDVSGDGLQDFIWAVKVNGVSRRKAWLNTGSGWVESPTHLPPFDILVANTNAEVNRIEGEFVDVNGDGLRDFVRAVAIWEKKVLFGGNKVSYRTTWLNTGSGWLQDDTYKAPFDISYDRNNRISVYGDFVDVDGNGLLDFVEAYKDGANVFRNTWLNTGGGWLHSPGHNLPSDIWRYGIQEIKSCEKGDCNVIARVWYSRRIGEFVDVDGDGIRDFVQATQEANTTALNAWINSGDGWVPSSTHRPPAVIREYKITKLESCRGDDNCTSTYVDRLRNFGEFVDVNGDGLEVVPNRWTAWRRLLGGIP